MAISKMFIPVYFHTCLIKSLFLLQLLNSWTKFSCFDEASRVLLDIIFSKRWANVGGKVHEVSIHKNKVWAMWQAGGIHTFDLFFFIKALHSRFYRTCTTVLTAASSGNERNELYSFD
jgi:hypothetical protein